jgi:hypothetical protein
MRYVQFKFFLAKKKNSLYSIKTSIEQKVLSTFWKRRRKETAMGV